MVGLGMAFLAYWIWDLEAFNYTSSIFAYCWIWNVSALYFLVSIGLHCQQHKIAPSSLGPRLKKNKDEPTPVAPWDLCQTMALILFQTAFDISWAGLVAYGVYFVDRVTDIGQVIVMAFAFILPPILLLVDLAISQLVFVPLHFVFPIVFLFLWCCIMWAYTTVCETLGDCGQYYNATACQCSRTAKNDTDIVQCFNASVGFCKWTEWGRCGWPYNPSPYRSVMPSELCVKPLKLSAPRGVM